MPDFALAQVPNFGQAALSGYAAGRQIRQQQRAEDKVIRTEAALKGFLTDPEGAITQADQFDPELGQSLRQRRAMSLLGDQYAAGASTPQQAQIARLDPEMYAKFDDRQRTHVKQAAEFLGQRALQIARLPAAQRGAAWDNAVEAGAELGMDLSGYRGKYSDQTLLNVLAQANEMKEFLDAQEPKRVPVEAGGTVYEQPGAIDPNFGLTGQPPAVGGGQITPEAILQGAAQTKRISRADADAVRASLGPNGGAAFDNWLQKNGISLDQGGAPAPVSKTLSNGQTAYFVNGEWYDNPEGR